MNIKIPLLALILLSSRVSAQPGEAVRGPAALSFESALKAPAPAFRADESGPLSCYSAARDLTNYPPLLCAGAADAAPVACFKAAKGLTNYPALLCSGAASSAPVDCFQAAGKLTNFPALLCARAQSAGGAIGCFHAAKGQTDYPALLCSGATSAAPLDCFRAA